MSEKSPYREEMRALRVWCQQNTLSLNNNKTKEPSGNSRGHTPIHIDGTAVEKMSSFKFLGVHIMDKLKWSTHTDMW